MQLSAEDQKTIWSASRWGIAVVVVVGLNMLVVLSSVFEGGLRDFIVDVASLFVMGRQAVALAVASLAFTSRRLAEAFESGLASLRTCGTPTPQTSSRRWNASWMATTEETE